MSAQVLPLLLARAELWRCDGGDEWIAPHDKLAKS